MNNVTSGHHLGFSNFQIFDLDSENGEKTIFINWNLPDCKMPRKVFGIKAKIVAFLAKN